MEDATVTVSQPDEQYRVLDPFCYETSCYLNGRTTTDSRIELSPRNGDCVIERIKVTNFDGSTSWLCTRCYLTSVINSMEYKGI